MLIVEVVIGAALLAAIIVILVLLLGRTDGGRALPTTATTATASSSPSASATATATVTPPSPSRTATAAPTPAPAPTPTTPGTNVQITSFTINPAKVDCSAGAPADSANLSVSWKSVKGSAAYFGVNTADAKTGGMGWTLPASCNQHDFPAGYDPFAYTCASTSVTYTITVTGSGSQQCQTVTVYHK